MHVILDTSVIISALLSPKRNHSEEIIRLAQKKKITLITCERSHKELQSSIQKVMQKMKNVNNNKISRLLAWYKYNTVYQKKIQADIHMRIRDKNDIYLLRLTEVSQPDYLISLDKDLLTLKNYKQTQIILPGEFMKQYLQS